jgi:hypothetical protein
MQCSLKYKLKKSLCILSATLPLKTFPLSKCPDLLRGPPSFQFHGYWGSSPGAKGPRSQADQSPPSSADVKNEWHCLSKPPHASMAWTGTTVFLTFMVDVNLFGGKTPLILNDRYRVEQSASCFRR